MLILVSIDRTHEKHLGWIDSQNQESKDLLLEYREATQSFETYRNYLPKHFVKLDQEQQKAEPQPLSHDEKIAEAKQVNTEYNILLEKYPTQYVDQSVKKELKGYQQKGAGLRSQIEALDQNKPMLFGKKDWDEKREKLVNEYQGVQHLHEHTKTENANS